MAIEKPAYEVVEEHGYIEIRRYAPMTVAKTFVRAGFKDAGNVAFRRLADYIFGSNDEDMKISMTAPVMQYGNQAGDDGYWVTFMMPSQFEMTDLPAPRDDLVKLEYVEGGTYAAVRYRGGWSEEKYRSHEKKLFDGITHLDGWRVVGDPLWARYDPPFMPSWFRTNEILIRIDAGPAASN